MIRGLDPSDDPCGTGTPLGLPYSLKNSRPSNFRAPNFRAPNFCAPLKNAILRPSNFRALDYENFENFDFSAFFPRSKFKIFKNHQNPNNEGENFRATEALHY